MNNDNKIETIDIGGEQVRVLYITKKTGYTDAQKRAIYKYMEKNRNRVNEQTRTRERRYYQTKRENRLQKMMDVKNAVQTFYEMCNIELN